jgi:thiol-disulfide isomerase/thioredoxin
MLGLPIKKLIKVSTLAVVSAFSSHAQTSLPEPLDPKPAIGLPMPHFSLGHVTNFSKSEITLEDFRGRWLFLTFWFPGCVNCIRALPIIDQFQKQFSASITFLAVGINSFQYKGIENVYERLRSKYGLDLIVAYDSILYQKWNIWSMPYIIIVDSDGIVRCLTNGSDMTSQKIKDLIEGKDVEFYPAERNVPRYDISKFPGTEDSTLVYRSVLTRWRGETSTASNLAEHVKWPKKYRDMGVRFVGLDLSRLYRIAYWSNDNSNVTVFPDGTLGYPVPVLKVKNDTLFRYDSTYNDFRGIYNYNLAVNPSRSGDLEYIKNVFQGELKNIFGYKVSVEKRRMLVWRLVADPGATAKLSSRGGKTIVSASPVSISLQNAPIETFCNIVIYNLSNAKRIFIDYNETGYSGNIDVSINAVLTDLDDMRAALRQIGFNVIAEEKEVKVLVISDP